MSGVRFTGVDMREAPNAADAWTTLAGRGPRRDSRDMGPYLLQMEAPNGMKSSSSSDVADVRLYPHDGVVFV